MGSFHRHIVSDIGAFLIGMVSDMGTKYNVAALVAGFFVRLAVLVLSWDRLVLFHTDPNVRAILRDAQYNLAREPQPLSCQQSDHIQGSDESMAFSSSPYSPPFPSAQDHEQFDFPYPEHMRVPCYPTRKKR